MDFWRFWINLQFNRELTEKQVISSSHSCKNPQNFIYYRIGFRLIVSASITLDQIEYIKKRTLIFFKLTRRSREFIQKQIFITKRCFAHESIPMALKKPMEKEINVFKSVHNIVRFHWEKSHIDRLESCSIFSKSRHLYLFTKSSYLF